MSSDHEDTAFTIEPDKARELLARATPKGRRLLELFARRQLLEFADLREEFRTSQNGLNALLGHLTREFQQLQGEPGFYIYISRLGKRKGERTSDDSGGWAIGHASGVNLRRAIKDDERSRQGRIDFPRDS